MNEPISTNVSSGSGAINAPGIDPATLRPQVRAIKDAGQAWDLVRSFKAENRERNRKNARIADRYNAERPFNPEELKAQGLDGNSNFSTKPLAHLIDKVAPRFTAAVKSMRYLTNSAFPDDFPGAPAKSEAFRGEITKLCRNREGWNDFLADVSQENALYGFTSVAWLDPYTWFPKHFRQDKFFVPVGTKHYSASAQVYIIEDEWLLHELFGMVEDPQAAKDAGWNVENTVAALNAATPEPSRSRFSDPERVYADLTRELSVAQSFSNGARTVGVYHVFATEVTGAITHYIVTAKEGKELFHQDDRFAGMQEVTAFYSFQHGNGKIHGSKGIGREVYNMAVALDRARNSVVDRLQMSGKAIFTGDEKLIKRFRMSVVGSAILVSSAFVPSNVRIDGDVEPFLKLDAFFTDLLDQIAGSSSPKALEGDRVTKAAVELYASREEERRDAVIERFLSQFIRMMATVQKRACDPNCRERDALEMQQRLLKVMSPQELAYLAEQSPAETVSDYSDMERQQIIMAATEGRGNPAYNQKELERRKLTAQISSDFAEAVLLPDNDPTELAEQSRLQQMENSLIAGGQRVAVSPRDNFLVHYQELEPIVMAAAAECAQSPGLIPPDVFKAFQAAVQHGLDHLNTALQFGADKKAIAEPMAKISGWVRDFQKLQQHEAQLQQLVAQAQQPQQLPPGVIPFPGPGAQGPAPAAPAAPAPPSPAAPVNQPPQNDAPPTS